MPSESQSRAIALYRRLLVHRSDVFARQYYDGHYEPTRRPLEDTDLVSHLDGSGSLGVYVIDPMAATMPSPGSGHTTLYSIPDTVKYVVFDLDTYDRDALAWLCKQAEILVGPASLKFWGEDANEFRKCLLLEDSGGKGYHIWLFLSEPIPAARVRAWTENIRDGYRVEANRTASAVIGGRPGQPWPALEIFPKQDRVPDSACPDCQGGGAARGRGTNDSEGDCVRCSGSGHVAGYGNLVKLPFGRHAVTKAWSQPVIREGWAFTLDEVIPYDVALIPPATGRISSPVEASASGATGFACVNRILEEGAGQGVRNKAMLHLAHYARGCGLPSDITVEWCLAVNELFDPPLREGEVRITVASVYRMEAQHPSCNAEWLPEFCPGSERLRMCPNYQGPEPGATVHVEDGAIYMSREQRRAQRNQDG